MDGLSAIDPAPDWLRALLAHAITAIAVLDRDLRYLAHTDRWLTDYRVADPPILGRGHFEVFPDAAPVWRGIYERVLAGEVVSCAEESFLRKDGAHGSVRWKVVPWHDVAGAVGGVVIFSQIITAEVEARRFREELIANVSHEMRAPLASVVGALAMLGEAPEATAPAPALLGIARKNVQRLARIVDDLLETGRIAPDSLDFVIREVDLGWMIADAVELNRPFADRHNITLDFARPPHPVPAAIDPDRMLQVLGNLLTNAVKFSKAGDTVRMALTSDGGGARIDVIDTGCGMSPGFQAHLFERFAREQGVVPARPGSGLGLAITKGLVERMGGTIAITSAAGVGTSVRIALPRAGDSDGEG